MRLPEVHGVIRRRILVNYRVEPEAMRRQLPAPLCPRLYAGYAIAGICLIRLEEMRPRGVPRLFGLASENAAHRVAVVWDDRGQAREGVYIPRRDTGSLLNRLAGGRVFPGEYRKAFFRATDDGDRFALHMLAADGFEVEMSGRVAQDLPATSVFPRLGDASAFFEAGALGYSTTAEGDRLDGVVLRTHSWTVEPLAIERVSSSYFADESRFPKGSVTFDCALLMRNVAHEWHAAPSLRVEPAAAAGTQDYPVSAASRLGATRR